MKFAKIFLIVVMSLVGITMGVTVLAAGGKAELVRVGDFSIALTDVKREEKQTSLHFVITKVADTDSGAQSLNITVIDDHGNEYSGGFNIDLEGASDFVINALPRGFTYVAEVKIPMPGLAPIERIRLGEKEFAFKDIKFSKPEFLKDFGDLTVAKGQSVLVGKWLYFTMEKAIPAPHHWELLITIENREYNPLPAGLKIAVQQEDGTISLSEYKSTTVTALSKTSVALALPIPSWVKEGPPQPRALLLIYADEKTQEAILGMYAFSPSDLSPLVGQGPRRQEDIFLQAYERNGGREVMGDPVGLPHWFAGDIHPKDENDVLIQEFLNVTGLEKSAIIWDKQGHASEAYVVHGAIWERYSNLGGPYFVSKVQKVALGAPTSDVIAVKTSNSYFKTEGIYSTFQGGAIVSQSGQTAVVMGKIFEKWKEKGLTKSSLGFPIGDEQHAPTSGAQGFNTKGLVQDFEGGHIYYHSTGNYMGQAFEIHGDVDSKYIEMGAVRSLLGFPISDADFVTKFEVGYILRTNGRYETFPPKHSFRSNGYLVVKKKMGWHDAKRFAEWLGGHLVTIEDEAENRFVADLARGEGVSRDFWIGLTDEVKEGEFIWVTGEPLSYTNWHLGEPSNWGVGGNEHYVEIGYFDDLYSWNDSYESDNQPFVVEFDGIVPTPRSTGVTPKSVEE